MFRALSLAIGITLGILGLECMVVDRFIFAKEPAAETIAQAGGGRSSSALIHEYEPPEWMPWSLMSAGAVIILYSFTIPRRVAN